MRAKQLLALLEERVRRGGVAQCFVGFGYSAIGDRGNAIAWLNRALEAREPACRDNIRTMFARELRGDPRYEALLERLARGFEN